MTTTTTTSQRRPLAALILSALALLTALALGSVLTSCDRHIDKVVSDPGDDGRDGKDGADGLDGLGFDYVRGLDGARINSGLVVMDARDVVPAAVLAWQPPTDYSGLTLTFGTKDAPTRVYLADVEAGASCVIDLCDPGTGWKEIGQVKADQVALVPIEFALALDIAERGVRVDFPGEGLTLSLIWHGRALLLGECVVITLGND